jgi:phospholipid-binding lipoprotein MlaA
MTKKIAVLSLIAILQSGLVGCASSEQPTQDQTPTIRHFTSQAEAVSAEKPFTPYDPAQTLNKNIYKFNAELDTYVFLPIVDAYTYITPSFFRQGVTNFFLNFHEITNFANALLQAKPYQATKTLGRFVINTTIGLAGTFDVATDWGIERQPEDFGKTLGYWGAESGAYIVLPVLGPSNVRDTVGTLADFATLYFVIPKSVQDNIAYDVATYGLEPIDLRATNEFRYFSTGSPFDYELVRYFASQKRDQEISNERK